MSFNYNKKRKYKKNGNSYKQGAGNFKFGGGPAILFTCETGRESRVRRESIALLDHYYPDHVNDEKSTSSEAKVLSLEDEIAQLKSSSKKKSCNFTVNSHFEVKGTVLVQCAIPSSIPLNQQRQEKEEERKIPESKSEAKDYGKDAESGEGEEDSEESEKKKQKQAIPPEFYDTCWNPVDFVRKILDNHKAGSERCKNQQIRDDIAPDSRFITRIIPLQATCRATVEDITSAATPLLEHYIFSENQDSDGESKKSFEIVFKKRNCSHFDRMECITAIAKLFDSTKYSVNLTNPDYSIIVEVCKNFCGISVIEGSAKSAEWSNFNVQEMKDDKADRIDDKNALNQGT